MDKIGDPFAGTAEEEVETAGDGVEDVGFLAWRWQPHAQWGGVYNEAGEVGVRGWLSASKDPLAGC